VLNHFLSQVHLNKFILDEIKVGINLEDYLGTFVSYVCYAISILIALNTLNIMTPVFFMVVGGLMVLLLISLIVGIRDFFPNLFAGFKLMRGRSFKENERILFECMKLKVVNIGFLETKLITKDGDILFIPNSELEKKRTVNITRNAKKAKRK